MENDKQTHKQTDNIKKVLSKVKITIDSQEALETTETLPVGQANVLWLDQMAIIKIRGHSPYEW